MTVPINQLAGSTTTVHAKGRVRCCIPNAVQCTALQEAHMHRIQQLSDVFGMSS